MSRSLRRGAIAALVLAAIVPLSACAAGNTPDTLEVTPDNASTSIGNDLNLNNIVVVTRPEAVAEHTGPANVTVNISNSGTSPETLQSITVGDGSTATFTTDKGAPLSEIVIPAGGSVLLGGEGQPAAHLSSVTVTLGGFAPTSFSFAKAGKVGTQAQVVPARGYYVGYGPGGSEAAASPSASVSVAPSASASASATASGSASATASASASALAGAPAKGSASPSATAH